MRREEPHLLLAPTTQLARPGIDKKKDDEFPTNDADRYAAFRAADKDHRREVSSETWDDFKN